MGLGGLHDQLRLGGIATEAVLKVDEAIHDPMVDNLEIVHNILLNNGV